MLWELKECLQWNFSRVVVAYNPCSCNLVAHSLAALGAKLCPGTNPIMDSIPTCINVLVAHYAQSVTEIWAKQLAHYAQSVKQFDKCKKEHKNSETKKQSIQ